MNTYGRNPITVKPPNTKNSDAALWFNPTVHRASIPKHTQQLHVGRHVGIGAASPVRGGAHRRRIGGAEQRRGAASDDVAACRRCGGAVALQRMDERHAA